MSAVNALAAQITYRLTNEPEDIPVHGNAGDDEQERWVVDQLRQGNDWAWTQVMVTAELTLDGETYRGHDSLGGCSYLSEEDFKTPGGYYDDMLLAALDDLKQELQASVRHGQIAAQALEALA